YLSDLEAAGFRHTPYLSLSWPYHRDRNVQGGQLRSGGRAYLKGLGLHSTSLISYTLPKAYRRLDAEIGIDDETAQRGSAIFRVYVDSGDGQWQRRYESPIVRGGRPPIPISVDLKGAKRIGLLVDFADRGDELDHADWLDARLVP
ncbi:MAG: NPCBM/NEW2 domain-containing protein, partial [Planctomycetia bacterium]|nr:NPCBM/NEW2 domain-containing protein [Planctomycetia bacterium]